MSKNTNNKMIKFMIIIKKYTTKKIKKNSYLKKISLINITIKSFKKKKKNQNKKNK